MPAFRFCRSRESRELGRHRDVSDCATHRAFAIKSTLWTPQHLDALHVEQGQSDSAVRGISTDRQIVEVFARRWAAENPGDAANLDVSLSRAEIVDGQPRNRILKVLHAGNVLGADISSGDHRN